MAERTDMLTTIYQNHFNQFRHYEMLHVSVTNLMLIVAAGVLAFIANNGITKDKWPLAVFLIVIGFCGILFTAKIYEIMEFNVRVATEHRKELETLLQFDSSALREKIQSEHKRNHPYLFKKKFIFIYWTILHSLIGFLGLFLFGYILSK